MTAFSNLRKALQSILLGQSGFLTAFDIPLEPPQIEVGAWLHGLGEPRDVTNCHSVACPMPCILCISFDLDEVKQISGPQRVSLHFVRGSRLLGKIDLQYQETIITTGPHLQLYRATDCIASCLPPYRRWIRSAYFARERWKARRSGLPQISSLDSRCNEVVFFCPRPIVLVSLRQGGRGNIFPMNLMGHAGNHHFVFALNRSKMASAAVSAILEVAISTIPFEYAELVRQLGPNHHQTSIDFGHQPFSTYPSGTFEIPVPEFALTVRELRVESIVHLGSHDFFVARIISTEIRAHAPEFYRIHGLYAAQRR